MAIINIEEGFWVGIRDNINTMFSELYSAMGLGNPTYIISDGLWGVIKSQINEMYLELMNTPVPTTTVAPTTTAVTTTEAPIDLLTGLIGAWELDEAAGDAIDAVGSDDGTVSGCTREQAGVVGYSYSFNHSNSDKITLGDHSFSGKTLSISGWIKGNLVSDSLRYGPILSTDGNDIYLGYAFQAYQNTRLKARINGVLVDGGEVEDTGWHHMVVTYNGNLVSNNIKLYVDKILVGQGDETGDIGAATAQLIGQFVGGTYFNGYLDAIRTWSITLTQEQITYLYDTEFAGTGYPW